MRGKMTRDRRCGGQGGSTELKKHGVGGVIGGAYRCQRLTADLTGRKQDAGLILMTSVQFSSVQSLNCVRLFATPWTTARQASLSQSLLKLMSIESVMPSNHLILCHPLLLLPPIPPSIRVFSNESTLHLRWPKYWSFSFRN